MTHVLCDRFRRWLEYEKNSHALVMASLESVPEGNRTDPAYQKAGSLMAHIAEARQFWLFRLGITKERPTEWFPSGWTFAQLSARIDEVQAAWSKYLSDLQDDDLGRVFEYQSYEGAWYRNTVEDVLTQLFGHSWYHRGQIAMQVRQAGGEPAVTDMIFSTRQPIATPNVKA
jgi:uncharacterized damage-inducible protein DinB